MRIGCLQFAPQVGDINNNLNRADAVLNRANPEDLDLLVLPELAFSGYNFKSLSDISPFLEPTCAGITSLWARTTALKYNCAVAAGYPEKVDVSRNWPTSPEYYNSVIVVNEEGETIANYRKSHLYYTDETWALEGPTGFHKGYIPGIGKVAMGICMDLKFEAPWSAFEFAFHALDTAANVVILSMAWLTREDARHFSRMPKEPDMETLTYWVKRLEPLIRTESEEEIIVIFGNRCGIEGDAVYAGTSAVLGIQNGEVNVYGLLGRGEKELLIVDTSRPPFAKLLYRPDLETHSISADGEPGPESLVPGSETDLVQAESPSSSILSSSSNASESNNNQAQHAVSMAGDSNDARESAHRISGEHFFVTQDALAPMVGNFPLMPLEESPVSPSYFWQPPEHHISQENESPSQWPPSSGTHVQDPKSSQHPPGSGEAHEEDGVKYKTEVLTPYNLEQPAEFSELVETLRQVTVQQEHKESCPARPSSPKSRNTSRTGRGERSNSVLAQRPGSVFDHRTQDAIIGQGVMDFRTESAKTFHASRSESRNRRLVTQAHPPEKDVARNSSRKQSRPKPLDTGSNSLSRTQSRNGTHESAVLDSDQIHHHSSSPDLEKLGADLLVFEESERRPRRDSLECHADDDDFVVFHASMRRDHQGGIGSNGDKDAGRPASQKGTPRHIASPGFSFVKSPGEMTASSMPQDSPDLSDAQGVSRGRPRKAKWSQAKDSPKSLSHKSSGLSSPPEKWDKLPISDPTSPFGRYMSSETVNGPGPLQVSPTSKTRHLRENDIQSQLKATVEHTENVTPTKILRETSHKSERPSSTKNVPSTRTVKTAKAPTAQESIPLTPKAMVLEPGWDEVTPATIVPVDTRPLKPMDAATTRPKSMVW